MVREKELNQLLVKKVKKFFAAFLLILFSFYNTHFGVLIAHSTYVNQPDVNINGDFEINNDSTETFSTSVTLNMDISGVTQMRFGNTTTARDSASWETYSATKAWTLISGEGKKTVHGSFRNAALDVVNISDDIVLHNTPTLPYSTGLTLWLDAQDAATISDTAGEVTQWDDKSGNAYHALQDTAIEQPNLLTDEIDFNGSSEYFYLQNLNYTNASPLDGLLVCGVFKTNHVSSSYNDNWAILDFDRSEWFDFYNKGGDYGFSYDSNGTIRDITTSGVGINDNEWHVTCASYDNTLTNDTVITVNGTTEYSGNVEPNGAQIGVSQATRYGFIGDGSEAGGQDGGRNNIYYDGGIGELIYFDTNVTATDRKDLECYLGLKWGVDVSGCPETISPIASVTYAPEFTTSSDVVATLDSFSEPITITNNGGSATYTFTANGSFTFIFEDENGNTGSTTATVDWIDPAAPASVGTGSLNEAPTITSYSGSTSHTISVGSGAIDVATISATDVFYNVVGEYGTSSLSGNTWQQINTYEMCSPVVTVSHRQDVNGETQRAPRVRTKTGTGFEVHVDNYDSTIGAITTDIDYIVMNAGTHNFAGGLLINAGSQTTSAVACNASNSPTPTAVTFSTDFIQPPVVTHTISTENDSTWVVSGVNANNGTRGDEPLIGGMGTVLQRSFNSCTHSAEDVDYVAVEPGNYTLLDGTVMDAVRSTDSIASVTASGNPITFGTAFSSAPNTVLVSQLGEDGGNGGYAQIHSVGGVNSTVVNATIDEDGPSADRSHTAEVAASIAFDKSSGQFWESNTISYSITGGADSTDFTIDSDSGELEFLTGKTPSSYTDANTDGIYEVIVSACDSHCNSACSTQTILADTRDLVDPVVDSINFASGSLLPGGNHSFEFSFSDEIGGSGIDITSETITLQKWNGSSWDPDISATGFGTGTITSTGASYPSNNLAYGKYRTTFTIDDIAGNSATTFESVFYIDIPEFSVSTPEIDMGIVNHLSPSFSPEVTVTVKTVGAGFSVIMNRNTDLTDVLETIPSWDGTEGYGYDKEVYTNNANTIGTDENIATQTGSINTNGELNTYTYKVKLGALVDEYQVAGEYEGSVDFGIELDY